MVDEFYVQEDLACDGVVGVPDLFEVDEGVDGGEEGSVEPATALGDELGYRVCGALDVEFLMRKKEVSIPGTSVSPLQFFTYLRTHLSSLLATSSQHRMRSSARYIFAVNTSAFCPCSVSPLKY